MKRTVTFSFIVLLGSAGTAPTQPTPNTPPPPDHGMVLATCMEVAPGKLKDTTKRSDTKNYVFRGRVITLDKEKSVHLCFDTDLMRVAGAWVGRPVAYAADKNMGPAVEGKMIFSTKPRPGWANKDGKWDDPREGGEGPLPKEWAHYKGMYLHGDKVVLSYTVGECQILEEFGIVKENDDVLFTRTLQLGASTKPLSILVCDEVGANWKAHEVAGGLILLAMDLRPRKPSFAAVAMGTPRTTEWTADGTRLQLELPALENGALIRIVIGQLDPASKTLLHAMAEDIKALGPITKGGPPRWKDTIETKATLTPAGKFPYVVDDIGLPTENPWHASIRFGGLDFFSDGRAALCTWDGDVWIVDGLARRASEGKEDPSNPSLARRANWKRFAAGLHQPLGLKIVNDFVYVAGRDQITKLHDLNGDGEADFYENFNNDAALTLQRHEFVLDLQTDKDGNFYFGRSGHYVASKRGDNCCIYKLSPDGKKLEKFATGFREPNGLSIGPDGTMIVGDNEGNGIPQTPIYRLEQGGFYGFRPSKSEDEATKGATWEYARKPIVWLPISVDRSAGSQVWTTDERFGPLKGQLLHTSYGHAALYGVLIDKQAEPWQGAVWKLPLGFSSGVMRARVNPKDGQVYLCGLRGWSTNAVKDGQFCRVRYTGGEPSGVSRRVPLPVGFEVVKGGMKLTFSDPLDRKAAEDDENWTGEWANLVGKAGAIKSAKEELPITAVRLSGDRKSVTVSIDKLRPMSNFTLQYRVKGADATPASGDLHGTIHRVP